MAKSAANIKELHQDGLKGIVDILLKKGTLKKYPFWISLIVSLIVGATVFFITPSGSFKYLKDTVELTLSFFPNLLGFSLGGYALVVGFSNLELVKAGSRTDKHSVYQILNAIFSLCLICQVFTTLASFILSWVFKVDIFALTRIDSGVLGVIVNCMLLALIVFTSLYSLLLTPYLITNLFTLSQVNNLFLTVQKFADKNRGREVEKREEKNSN